MSETTRRDFFGLLAAAFVAFKASASPAIDSPPTLVEAITLDFVDSLQYPYMFVSKGRPGEPTKNLEIPHDTVFRLRAISAFYRAETLVKDLTAFLETGSVKLDINRMTYLKCPASMIPWSSFNGQPLPIYPEIVVQPGTVLNLSALGDAPEVEYTFVLQGVIQRASQRAATPGRRKTA